MLERLKLLRKNLGLTQAEFGAKIGFKPSSVGTWEKGFQKIPEYAILAICSTFNVSRVWLETGAGDMFAAPAVPAPSLVDQLVLMYSQLSPELQKIWRDCAARIIASNGDEKRAAVSVAQYFGGVNHQNITLNGDIIGGDKGRDNGNR